MSVMTEADELVGRDKTDGVRQKRWPRFIYHPA